MPKIPVAGLPQQLTLQGPRSQGTALAPGGAFQPGPMAQAAQKFIGDAAKLMIQVGAEQQDLDNQAWARDAKTKQMRLTDEQYIQNTDKHRLDGANGITKLGSEQFNKTQEEILKSAPNREAREMFLNSTANVKRSSVKGYANYEAQQKNQFRINTFKTNISAATDHANANWNLPVAETEEWINQNIIPEIEGLARMTGNPAEVIEAQTRSDIYSTKIRQYLASGDTEGATTLFKHYDEQEGFIKGVDVALRKEIRRFEVNDQADAISKDLILRLKTEDIDGDKANGIVRNIKDKQVKDATAILMSAGRQEVKSFQVKQTNILKKEYKDVLMTGLSLDAGGNVLKESLIENNLSEKYKYVNALPEETISQKDSKIWAQSQYAWLAAQKGLEPQTNPDSYNDILWQIEDGVILTQDQLDNHLSAASVAQKDLEDLQKALKNGQSTKLLTTTFKNTLGPEATNKEQLSFMQWASKQIAQTNRGNDPEYVQNLVDTWMSPAVLQKKSRIFGISYDRETTFGEAFKTVQEREDLTVKDIKLDVPDKISAEIEKRFNEFPKVGRKWLRAAGGDREVAIQNYYREKQRIRRGTR